MQNQALILLDLLLMWRFVTDVIYNVFNRNSKVLLTGETKVGKSQELLELIRVFNGYFPDPNGYGSFTVFKKYSPKYTTSW